MRLLFSGHCWFPNELFPFIFQNLLHHDSLLKFLRKEVDIILLLSGIVLPLIESRYSPFIEIWHGIGILPKLLEDLLGLHYNSIVCLNLSFNIVLTIKLLKALLAPSRWQLSYLWITLDVELVVAWMRHSWISFRRLLFVIYI